jgi:hypothetical protein
VKQINTPPLHMPLVTLLMQTHVLPGANRVNMRSSITASHHLVQLLTVTAATGKDSTGVSMVTNGAYAGHLQATCPDSSLQVRCGWSVSLLLLLVWGLVCGYSSSNALTLICMARWAAHLDVHNCTACGDAGVGSCARLQQPQPAMHQDAHHALPQLRRLHARHRCVTGVGTWGVQASTCQSATSCACRA